MLTAFSLFFLIIPNFFRPRLRRTALEPPPPTRAQRRRVGAYRVAGESFYFYLFIFVVFPFFRSFVLRSRWNYYPMRVVLRARFGVLTFLSPGTRFRVPNPAFPPQLHLAPRATPFLCCLFYVLYYRPYPLPFPIMFRITDPCSMALAFACSYLTTYLGPWRTRVERRVRRSVV
jgi:hypothetical protein